MEKLKKYFKDQIKQEESFHYLKRIYETDEKVFENLDQLFSKSKQDLRELSKIVNWIIAEKYKRKNQRYLGNEARYMPDSVFNSLLEHFHKVNQRIELIVQFEGLEASRIGDVVELKLENFDFKEHEVRVYNHKADRWYKVPLEIHLEQNIKKFIEENKEQIKIHHNYIFFSNNLVQKRDFLSKDWVRNKIREAVNYLGLQKVYATSIDGKKLNMYSSHSLRSHAITRAYNLSGGDVQVSKELADHKKTDTNFLYIAKDHKKLENIMRV
jgi:integrase